MKKISEMTVIQIDITNACVHRCSNCTRFCGHHKKNFFMDFETFKKAVDSLDEYKGCVGIIGGEPTLHPEFEKFCDYLKKKRLNNTNLQISRYPINNISDYISENFTYFSESKTGLWSSLNNLYYKYYETIQDTFECQNLNDHNNICEHQALLMPRKELGISDEEWIKKRDACWIQNTWSATITPKGAFFCEVAGSLDMLFNGPGGWDITKDWWKREVSEYESQLHWCELCSGCLDVPQRLSNDEIDDITPNMFNKLKEINSPKISKGLYAVYDVNKYNIDKSNYNTFITGQDYMMNSRLINENKNLLPKNFKIINKIDKSISLENKEEFKDWVIFSKKSNEAEDIIKNLDNTIINPGCLYKYNNSYIFNVLSRSIRDNLSNICSLDDLIKMYPKDKVIILKESLIDKIFSIKTIYLRKRMTKIINILGAKISIVKNI
ncbi:radical SAM protein [Brachyspira alvinipulli]|uniref:radical SAM protein n=1 Tax=Brachyspira alvinipulli TaxID=84379 RepID=UPI003003B781